ISGGPLLVTAPPSPVIAPNGSVDLLFHVSGGVPPYTMTLTGATLPPGVTFLKTTATGDTYELKGVFPAAGVFNLSVVASDSLGNVSPGAPVTITVASPLVFASATLPLGSVGQPYTATLQASGGKAPFTFSLAPGSSMPAAGSSLPAGLSLSPAGVISGTPLSGGQSMVSVTVTDALLQTVTAQFTLSISGGTLAIATPSVLPAAVTGMPYSQTLLATGGVPPYSFKFDGAPP
ncbi:MAG TPA: autotransporter outer membrane beta-barrel domain-containing protein, partial [Solibacterales bacterium]|nr:autotransporter outer membrane beta-barrel domain-containing protein [Bryobacterales bacterium]